jgi:integrase
MLNDLYLSLGKKGVAKNGGVLSNKTILEHHRLIHTVLEQAVREGMISFNPADRVERPKVEDKDAHFFRIDEIRAIKKAMREEDAPIKWRALVNLMMDTGCRRGEILGLKWDAVDFERSRIHICRNVQYTPDRGICFDTPKTSKSDRYIIVPSESMKLLKELRVWQAEDILSKNEEIVGNRPIMR